MLPQALIDVFYANRANMEKAFLDEYLPLSGLTAEEIEAWLAPCAACRLNSDIGEEEKGNVLAALRKAIAQ